MCVGSDILTGNSLFSYSFWSENRANYFKSSVKYCLFLYESYWKLFFMMVLIEIIFTFVYFILHLANFLYISLPVLGLSLLDLPSNLSLFTKWYSGNLTTSKSSLMIFEFVHVVFIILLIFEVLMKLGLVCF